MLSRVVWLKFSDILEVLTAFIIRALLMVETARTSEMSVNFYQTTRCNIPEDSRLHIGHNENLKYHKIIIDTNIERGIGIQVIIVLLCVSPNLHSGKKISESI
jgi:hypothetical protein